MKLGGLLIAAVAVGTTFGAVTTKAPAPVRDRNNGNCDVDADCAKFPGTVCVKILTGDYEQGKCTPNYGTRPVCRGGQAGLCPQYQDPSSGYLNTQCVLIDKAMQAATDTDAVVPVDHSASGSGKTPAASGTTPAASGTTPKGTTEAPPKGTTAAPPTKAARFLAETDAPEGTTAKPAGSTTKPAGSTEEPTGTTGAPKKTTEAPVDSAPASGSGSGSSVPRTPVKEQPCPTDAALTLADPKCWFTAKFKNATLTVQYKCVDYDMCLSQSAYAQESQTVKESYCRPKGCVTAPKALCNNRGTCQANSAVDVMLPRTYACRCYAGYKGTQCEKTDGTADCDVDCGQGGACIDNKCACYDGFIGKNVRCDKCTSNAACENKNTCDIESGKCKCAPGFNGDTCGGKLSVCAGIKCSAGGFIDGTGKTCICRCPKCPAGTTCTPCGGADGTDCSTCGAGAIFESSADGLSVAILTLAMATLAILF